jgi:anti-anti-sigma factor
MSLHAFLDIETTEDATLVRINGAVHTESAPVLGERLSRLVQESSRPLLRLDFGEVAFLTAAWLGKLVTLHKQVRAVGGRLTIGNVQPLAYEVFEVTRLTQVLDVRQAGKDILVVEDNIATRDELTTALEHEGYSVACAGDGREALDRLRQDGPTSLILLDLRMAGMDGWTFREHQQQDPALAGIPVVVVSGTRDVAKSAASLQAVSYHKKPVNIDRLLETVRCHC